MLLPPNKINIQINCKTAPKIPNEFGRNILGIPLSLPLIETI